MTKTATKTMQEVFRKDPYSLMHHSQLGYYIYRDETLFESIGSDRQDGIAHIRELVEADKLEGVIDEALSEFKHEICERLEEIENRLTHLEHYAGEE